MKRISSLIVFSLIVLLPGSAYAIKLANGLFVSVASGSQTIGPFNIPDNVDRFTITLKRCTAADLLTWPSADTQVAMMMQVSFDGGNTWQNMAGFTSVGGISLNKLGQEATETSTSAQIFPGTNRKGRIVATVLNGPLQTTLSLDVN